ncbi:MAG: hypothetical protein KDD69_06340 [Bdellovibrionales bacterium]|nr:hypothetical protein [Bdellovibrionales bacterium]
MPRARRYIKSNHLYEVSFRARRSLPLPCTNYMKILIHSIVARVQRDAKVILHHAQWEGNHPHLLCTAKDANECQRFYGQLKKQLTEAVKRLTGEKHLSLWEDRASVIEIPTLDDAIAKIGYIYANPSNDDLVSAIEDYPGVTTWEAFTAGREKNDVDYCASSVHPWIRQPMISKLPRRSVDSKQDCAISRSMLAAAQESHCLRIYPNSWIKVFIENPSPEEVQDILRRCYENLRFREQRNCERRVRERKKVMGATRLSQTPILGKHIPKKHGRRIFVQSIYKEVRLRLIQEWKEVEARCCNAYQHRCLGDYSVSWPPGTFPPPLPPLANALVCH